MSNEHTLKVLCDLAQLDIDATHAYDQALKNIEDKTVYAAIEKFRNDHIRHIDALSSWIRNNGGTPPERTLDFKGYIIEGMTTLRSVTGTIGALKAMETNEILTNKNYRQALEENPTFPAEVKLLLQANYADEQRHLNYIRQTIKTQEKA